MTSKPPVSRLLGEVLERIRPSARERAEERRFAAGLVARVGAACPAGCKSVLTGSMAKGTFLRDSKDIDIFVLFPRTVAKAELEGSIEHILRRAFPGTGYQLSYAEHPYARFHCGGRRVDLVPAYSISRAAQRISAVDRSVLHTAFVRSRLRKGLADDVLLLKAFLKANSLYGAEIKVQGFSGYLCELLVIRHGGFMKLARAAAKWKPPIFIDVNRHYRGKAEAGGAVARFGRFTVIDPTDRGRNVAAAVSRGNLSRFIALCRRFLKRPDAGFFLRKPESFREKVARESRGMRLISLTMPRPDVVDDVLWGQMYKMMGQLEQHLAPFSPKGILADDSPHVVRLAVILGRDRLPAEMVVEGPPSDMPAHVRSFRKSHKGARFIARKKRVCAIVRRPVTRAEDAVMEFFRGFRSSGSHLAYSEELIVLERGGKAAARASEL